jgi:hypothetical protein
MQVKANRVIVLDEEGQPKHFTDVEVIKGTYGLYVDYTDIIGKDPEGKDLTQAKFTMYPWERVVIIDWNEKTLIEQVREFVILTQLEDFSDILEDLEEELGLTGVSEEPTPTKSPNATGDNPYE